MRKQLLFLLTILVFHLSACKQVIETSKILVKKSSDVPVEKVRLINDLREIDSKETNKYLSFQITKEESGYYKLEMGDLVSKIYVSPGDSLYVLFELSKSDNIQVTGKGALLTNYIQDDNRFTKELFDNVNFDSIYSLTPGKFILNIDSLYNFRIDRLDEFVKIHRIDNVYFIASESKNVFYEASIEKNRYYRDHKFLTGEKPNIDEAFYAYLSEADFNNADLLNLDSYKDFLFTYFENVGLQEKDKTSSDTLFTELAFRRALETIDNPSTKSYVLYRIMEIHLNETPIDKTGRLIEDFNLYCQNKLYKDLINTYFSKISKLRSGKTAPLFSFPDQNGKIVSLEEFRGKLVFIDVWNSFCSPCFKEFQIIEQLAKEYSSEDIVFVGISYDTDEDLWKGTLDKHNLKGIQLYADGWNTQFGKEYLVYSNPRFILIDKQGKFIKAKAPKPSENIRSLIDLNLK